MMNRIQNAGRFMGWPLSRLFFWSVLGLFLTPGVSWSQLGKPMGLGGKQEKPIEWKGQWKQTAEGHIEVRLVGYPLGEWHIYSTDLPEGGPMPTSVEFGGDTLHYALLGALREEGAALMVKDEQWGLTLRQYDDSVVFLQTLQLNKQAKEAKVEIFTEYQLCGGASCDLSAEEFSFVVSHAQKGGVFTANSASAGKGEGELSPVTLDNLASMTQSTSEGATADATVTQGDTVNQSSQSTTSRGGHWGFFLLNFLAGLAGLLTPCIFPMIPLTVSYFLGKKGGRFGAVLNAVVFGLSIVAIYTLLGLLVSLGSKGADVIVDVTTHWVTNLIFFLLFVFFGAAFFSVFELRLPSSLSGKTDAQVDKRSGLLGSFFLALTTVIVSLSCVGPIVGALLVESASGPAVRPIIGMFSFGLGFSIPFTIFALFPRLLDKLPKSGGWLNAVKIVLGFVVLAFSLKFLLMIDQSLGWNLLHRNVFLAIWIVLALLLGFYLLGWIRFKMDSPIEHLGFFRMLLAAASFCFALYLVPGLFGAPLTGLSGMLPEYEADAYSWQGSGSTGGTLFEGNAAHWSLSGECSTPLFSDISLPAGLHGYRTLDEALACAKQSNRKVLVEFTGHGCVNCKEMAAKVLSDAKVRDVLNNQLVYAALYVDEKVALPESLCYTSPLDGKEKRTLGRMNLDIQKRHFASSGQPQFFLVDPSGEVLAGPMGRELNVERFLEFITQ